MALLFSMSSFMERPLRPRPVTTRGGAPGVAGVVATILPDAVRLRGAGTLTVFFKSVRNATATAVKPRLIRVRIK
jgi:hypothetical protein